MKKILITTLFVFAFIFTITFSAIAEEAKIPEKAQIPETQNLIPALKSRTLDLKCVKIAVEKRETAIITAVDAYTASIKKSFETRKNALSVAWDIAKIKERNIAIKSAFVQHKKAKRDALRIYKKARLITWQKFTKARISCKALPTGEDMSADINFND
ncbi:MAG: hypothetical protein ABH808_00400 [Candidatus Kuenenbacteria bacterium]